MPRLVAWAAASVLLAGCGMFGGSGGQTEARRLDCPEIGGTAETSDLRRYRGAGRDLTDLVVEARLTGVTGRCEPLQRRRPGVRIALSPAFEVMRGPASSGRALTVPYFVAVADPLGRIPAKQVFEIPVEFPANRSRLRVSGEEVTVDLPLRSGERASDYTVLVGFQLSEEELATNRRLLALRSR
ncbi:MAG: hypothetical protein NZ523_00085 [Elioraea sp.]|nr:hypothetical protein [Elioraea sp.]